MSIQTQIERLTGAKTALKTAIEQKGVAVPEGAPLEQYAPLVDQIDVQNGSQIIFDSGELEEETNLIGPIDISSYDHIRIVGKAYPSENSAGKRACMLNFGKKTTHKLLTNAGNGRLFDTTGNPVTFLIFLDKSEKVYTTKAFSGFNAGNIFDADNVSQATSSSASVSDGASVIYRKTAYDETQMYICAQDDFETRPWGVGTQIIVVGE